MKLRYRVNKCLLEREGRIEAFGERFLLLLSPLLETNVGKLSRTQHFAEIFTT